MKNEKEFAESEAREKLSPEFKYQLNQWVNMGHFLIETLIELDYKETATNLNQRISSPLMQMRTKFGLGGGKIHKVKKA